MQFKLPDMLREEKSRMELLLEDSTLKGSNLRELYSKLN